jgi:hypothetical protein
MGLQRICAVLALGLIVLSCGDGATSSVPADGRLDCPPDQVVTGSAEITEDHVGTSTPEEAARTAQAEWDLEDGTLVGIDNERFSVVLEGVEVAVFQIRPAPGGGWYVQTARVCQD